jgi:membrane protease YdiL (CAAX protease family)
MEEQPAEHQRPAWGSVIFILVTLLGGFIFVGPLIGIFLAIPFIEGSLPDFLTKMADPIAHPEIKTPLFIIQGCATFFGLAIGPSLYWWTYEKKNPLNLLKRKQISVLMLLVTLLIVMCFMVTNSVFIEWNAAVKFPDFLNNFYAWAKEKEDIAEQLTTFLTTFDSPTQFVLTFFVIAVLAGFSEELVFRGMLQPQLYRATHNIHAAIWITAFLFSALHMQFFGFVPRMLLGALFGYLYYWSGNLRIPMLAHIANNGFSVIALYLHQLGRLDIDVESTKAEPWSAVLPFTLITAGLLFYFNRYYKTYNSPSP